MRAFRFTSVSILLLTVCALSWGDNSFVGRWNISGPGDYCGWLEVTQEDGYLDGKLLWCWGSAAKVSSVCLHEDALAVTRVRKVKRKQTEGEVAREHMLTEVFIMRQDGENLAIMHFNPKKDGTGHHSDTATATRQAPMPPKPDLSKVKFGKGKKLLNGKDLTGWRLINPKNTNGWAVEDGVLVNNYHQPDKEKYINFGNLRTEEEFEDFNLQVEVNVTKNQNSGIYLRGIYEIQILGDYGEEPSAHGMGSLYSRIAPAVNASKKGGEWQAMDITLVDRHVTVKQNGKMLIDNQPVDGCTGGALWADDLRPGPLYLQGDHSGVKYRNFVLRPVLK